MSSPCLRPGGPSSPGLAIFPGPALLDLLLFLVRNRDRAVHRREIFDAVWSDVVVSDGALSQAVRSLRRALGDRTREPRFIRTVSRHGYQFVCAAVVEEADEGPLAPGTPQPPRTTENPDDDALEDALRLLTAGSDEETRRQAARPFTLSGPRKPCVAWIGAPAASRRGPFSATPGGTALWPVPFPSSARPMAGPPRASSSGCVWGTPHAPRAHAGSRRLSAGPPPAWSAASSAASSSAHHLGPT